MSKYIDAEKLIAEIERRREKCADIAADEKNEEVAEYYRGKEVAYDETSSLVASLQQEQPVHSHYTKVRETKTGRVFLAEYSSEAVEWYEAGTGKAYCISDVEIIKEQPEVDLEKAALYVYESWMGGTIDDVRRDMVELGKVLNARKK